MAYLLRINFCEGQAVLKLKEEGKIKAIGCCNTNLGQINQYNASGGLDSDQELYSILDRGSEKEILPYAAGHDIAFLAYSILGQGLLTGKIGPDRIFSEGDRRCHKPRFSVENRQQVQNMLATFRPVADKYSVSLGQLVISWTIAQKGCTHMHLSALERSIRLWKTQEADP